MESVRTKEFVVLSGQRSGSTLLVRSLDGSNDIFCAGEIFHPKQGTQLHHPEYQFKYFQLGNSKVTVAANRFLSRTRVTKHIDNFFQSASKGVKACGFKLMKSQLDWNPSILPFLKKRGVELIVLIRKSDFETALSMCKAQKSGTYHSDEAEEQKEVSLSKEDFERAIKRAEKHRHYLEDCSKELGIEPIHYEDLAEDWQGVIEEVGKRLGIDDLQVPMALKKLENSEGAVVVSNLSELKELYQVK